MSKPVNVLVVSPDTRSERHFDLHITVSQLKTKLEMITGIPVDAQIVTLHDASASVVSEVGSDDDVGGGFFGAPMATLDVSAGAGDVPIASYGVSNRQILRVVDSRPPGVALTGQFTDVSQVDKFELPDEEYAARRDTVLAYKKLFKIGRFADSDVSTSAAGGSSTTTSDADIITTSLNIKVGQRCEIVLDVPSEANVSGGRRGVVRFVGPTEFGTGRGVWVGVEYDEPVGKNDGSVEGKPYFSCRPKFGGFVRPEKVRVGDYPPLNLEEELEEM